MKLTGPQATVMAALIALAGIVIGSFLNPWAQKIINQPAPTTNPKSLALEQIKQHIFAYYGNAENLGGFANYNTIFDGADEKPYYELDYNVPGDQTGYAGLAFQFENGVNVSTYKSLALTIQFAEANSTVELYMKDISGQKGSVRIVSNGTDSMSLHYDLGNFGEVDFNALKEVGINIDNTFSNGRHVFTVHAITFEQ